MSIEVTIGGRSSTLDDIGVELAKSSFRSIDTLIKNRHLVRDGYDWTKSAPENGRYPFLFHGTSEQLLPSILKNGLSPQHNPLNRDDYNFVYQLCKRILPKEINEGNNHIPRAVEFKDGESNGLVAVYLQNSVSLSCDLGVATRYALEGPEKLQRIMPLVSQILRHRERLEGDEWTRLSSLQKQYSKIIGGHRPVVVVVQPTEHLYPLDQKGPFRDILHNEEQIQELVRVARGEQEIEKGSPLYIKLPDLTARLNLPVAVKKLREKHPEAKPEVLIQAILRKALPELEVAHTKPKEIKGLYSVKG